MLIAAGAVFAGWMAKDALSGASPTSAEPEEQNQAALVEALRSMSSDASDGHDTPPSVELTIVMGPDGQPTALSANVAGTSPAGVGDAPGVSGAASPTDTAGTAVDSSGPAAATAETTGTAGTAGPAAATAAGTTGHLVATTGSGSAPTPGPLVVGGSRVWAQSPASSGGLVFHLTPEVAVTAIGENIVIAYDDSVVLVGDDGRLTANTGDAGQGGVVALDAQGSELSSNFDPDGTGTGQAAAGSPLASSGTGAGAGPGSLPPDASSPVSPPISFGADRPVDIAGYEDHSLDIRGQHNVVTYDDSNVFIDRNGRINSNTGDTDSAGLNAVDTAGSVVTAGDHCDDGCDDESIIGAQAGHFDEGDDSDAGDTGDDEDEEADEGDDGDVSDPVEPPESREDAGTGTTPEAPPAGDALVIGGDGYDDLAVRLEGNDNVATYDDSNVVIGGTGDVNAQIGDSDTGGTVSMDTVDSELHGGNSR